MSELDEFERDLRELLRRREPPAGFADRVLARAGEVTGQEELRAVRHWPWRWAGVAAMVVALIGGLVIYREQRQRAEEEHSKEQLMYALRLTGSQVRHLRDRLAEVQQRRIELPVSPQ